MLVSSGQETVDSIQEDVHYAELWLGTHPKPGSENILEDGTNLRDFVQKHPELLGQNIVNNFGETLPFLFKILSIGHPLQLQIHPTREEARMLHQKDPSAFLDENHKPEMAVALTPFTALCGFRHPDDILKIAKLIPEFGEVLGCNGDRGSCSILRSSEPDSTKIRHCYEAVFQSQRSRDDLRTLQSRIYSRLKQDSSLRDQVGSEFLTLFHTFPGATCPAPRVQVHHATCQVTPAASRRGCSACTGCSPGRPSSCPPGRYTPTCRGTASRSG